MLEVLNICVSVLALFAVTLNIYICDYDVFSIVNGFLLGYWVRYWIIEYRDYRINKLLKEYRNE